ncbi:MAG: DUF4340 domain-containing protein [Congregibacter sp.]|nr:DUF4340 domain-containing protein [Congregibacter sp.]
MILRMLSVLLVAQLALALSLYWPQEPVQRSRESLITAVTADAVNQIQLSNGDGATLVLVRDADGWRLDLGFPADQDKVAALLRALTDADPGFPVADSDSAAKRFEVADDDFQRKIILGSATGQATAYLGSSLGLRKMHARSQDDSAVFVLAMSSYDAPVDIDSWLDTRLLARPALSLFALYGVEFALTDGRWSRSDGVDADQDKITALAQVLGNLQISGLVDAADEDAGSAGEALRISTPGISTAGITPTGNPDDGIAVLHNPDSDRYYLQSERFGEIFSTSAYDAQRLIDAARELFGTGDQDPVTLDG